MCLCIDTYICKCVRKFTNNFTYFTLIPKYFSELEFIVIPLLKIKVLN